MRFFAVVLSVSATVALLIAACSEVGTPTTAPLNLTVRSWEPEPSDRTPLEAVKVCEMDRADNCEWTDTEGEVALMLPIGETGYTMDKEGYAPWMHPHTMPAEGVTVPTSIPTAQHAADGHNSVGSPYPMRGTGTVAVTTGGLS